MAQEYKTFIDSSISVGIMKILSSLISFQSPSCPTAICLCPIMVLSSGIVSPPF